MAITKGQRVESTSGFRGTVIGNPGRLTRYLVDGCQHPSIVATWALRPVQS
jgi:hypothetical protein